MKNKWTMIPILMVMLVLGTQGVLALTSCTGYTYDTSGTDGTDYFGITTTAYNTTTMVSTDTTDKLWTGFSFFTPRLNVTKAVNETVTGGNTTNPVTLKWKSTETPLEVSVRNGSTVLGTGNYTIYSGGSNTWILNHTNNNYLGNTLLVVRNRTFVKNVDDIVLNPSDIYTGATTRDFLMYNSTIGYGDTLYFQFNSTSLGRYIIGTNWAVGWTYTTRTCAAIDQTSITGINNAKTTIFAALALLSVLLIITGAFGILKMIQEGSADLTFIATVIIGGGIVLMVGFIIIYKVAVALIG